MGTVVLLGVLASLALCPSSSLNNAGNFTTRSPSPLLRESLGHARHASDFNQWYLRAHQSRCKLRLIVALIPRTSGRDFQMKLMDECAFDSCQEEPMQCFKAGSGIVFVHIQPQEQPFRAVIWSNSKNYNFTLVSFLRDPVERVISEYYFFKDKRGAFSNWTNIKERGWHTLEQFAKASTNRNYMTGCLLGFNMWSHVVTKRESNQLLQNVRDGFERDLLFLGVLEEYVMSWRLLRMRIGLSPRMHIDSHHVNANRNKRVDDSLRSKIRKWNNLDAQLYDLALAHLRNTSTSKDSVWARKHTMV